MNNEYFDKGDFASHLITLKSSLREGRSFTQAELDQIRTAIPEEAPYRELLDVIAAVLCQLSSNAHAAAMTGHFDNMLSTLLNIQATSSALALSITKTP